MRSLVVSRDVFPWGESFGAGMRLNWVSRTLAELGEVDFLLLRTIGHKDTLPSDSAFRRIHIISQLPTWWPGYNDSKVTYIPESQRTIADRQRLLAELPKWVFNTNYDVIWYNRERTWLTMRDVLSTPSVIDVDDLNDIILERWLTLPETGDRKPLSMSQKAQVRRDIKWWQMVHRFAADQADTLVFASDHDKDRFDFDNSVVVPNAYEPASADHHHQPLQSNGHERPTILFPGRLTWPPNEDAALWLAETIGPRISAHIEGLRIILAGLPSARVQALATRSHVDVVGAVPEMAPYLRAADLVAVPLRAGSGTRIKILEAFAHRIPVVSTTIGAEGLNVVGGVHLELADSVTDITARCVDLLANTPKRACLTKEAHRLYQRSYRANNVFESVRHAVDMARTNFHAAVPAEE